MAPVGAGAGPGPRKGGISGPGPTIAAQRKRLLFSKQRGETSGVRGAQSRDLRLVRPPGVRPPGLRHGWAAMEVGLVGGRLSRADGPRTPPKTTPTMEELLRRLQETLDVLSPLELSNFRAILKKVDEEPRVSPLRLELEGGSPSGLARLVAKHYNPLAAPRVVVKVLRQLPRTDLLPRWQSDPAADGAGERGGARAATRRKVALGLRGIWPQSPGIPGPVPRGGSAPR